MKDSIAKKSGPYHSTSRAWEKAVKHRTVKMRRQAGKREARAQYDEAEIIPCEPLDAGEEMEMAIQFELWEAMERREREAMEEAAWEKQYWEDVRAGLYD